MSDVRSGNHTVLSVNGIAKTYDQVEALTDLSFAVRAGEIVGLLGPNGAGKTTAIRILTTILPPTRGHFSVMDIPDSQPEAIRALIGVLPESNGFPVHMSGVDFLTYMGRLYGQSESQARAKAVDLLRLFGLEKAQQARIVTYSRGMKQRLAIARSLVNDPKILFLDEPTLGFDPKGQQEMLQVIRKAVVENQVAVILSSHLLEVVEVICDRLIILNHGRLITEGSVAEIKKQVPIPHTCRIQVSPEQISKAISVLSTVEGLMTEPHNNHKDELIISSNGRSDDEMNHILQHLIQANIPIQGFSKDSVRLSDAFLSMIEEVQ